MVTTDVMNCDVLSIMINFNIYIYIYGGEPMTTNGDFWGLMGTEIHGDSRSNR